MCYSIVAYFLCIETVGATYLMLSVKLAAWFISRDGQHKRLIRDAGYAADYTLGDLLRPKTWSMYIAQKILNGYPSRSKMSAYASELNCLHSYSLDIFLILDRL